MRRTSSASSHGPLSSFRPGSVQASPSEPRAIGVLVVVVIGALLVARIVRGRGRLTKALAAFLVPALLVGSFWYFRNLVETGNPVEPVEVSALGLVVFDGPVELDDLLTVPVGAEGHPWPVQVLLSGPAILHTWVSADEGYSYEQRLGGLGPLWAYLGAHSSSSWLRVRWRGGAGHPSSTSCS